jgi:hypothetical protein
MASSYLQLVERCDSERPGSGRRCGLHQGHGGRHDFSPPSNQPGWLTNPEAPFRLLAGIVRHLIYFALVLGGALLALGLLWFMLAG